MSLDLAVGQPAVWTLVDFTYVPTAGPNHRILFVVETPYGRYHEYPHNLRIG